MMSDTTSSEPQGTPDAPAEKVEAPAQETTDWKAEARKWESRAKENAGAAKRLAEFEESQKTEIQKATERADAAEKALAAKEIEATRLRVAGQHGLPAELLSGTSEDEFEASAQKLIAFRGEQSPQPQRLVVPDEGGTPTVALNSDGLEAALKSALGIQ